jgi:integrase/recombinase XerC
MTSGNAAGAAKDGDESTSDNTAPAPGSRRRGRARTELPTALEEIHLGYVAQLKSAPVDDDTRRAYASLCPPVPGLAGDRRFSMAIPWANPHARDGAVRDYRVHLQTVARGTPAVRSDRLPETGTG